jgi:hypothetical protein
MSGDSLPRTTGPEQEIDAATLQPNTLIWRGAEVVEIADLIVDPRLLREVDEATVAEYAALMKDGVHFPPVETVRTDVGSFLTDGRQRIEATQRCGWTKFPVRVRDGEWDDVVEAIARSNATHGRRRTAGEKRQAVKLLFGLARWAGKSDREIARQCMVSDHTVAAVRAEISSAQTRRYEQPVENIEPESSPPPDRRVVRRGGQEYPITTPRPRDAEPELVPLTFEDSKRAANADREKALKESERYRERREKVAVAVVDGALAWFDKASTDRRLSFIHALMDKLTDAERWRVIEALTGAKVTNRDDPDGPICEYPQ